MITFTYIHILYLKALLSKILTITDLSDSYFPLRVTVGTPSGLDSLLRQISNKILLQFKIPGTGTGGARRSALRHKQTCLGYRLAS